MDKPFEPPVDEDDPVTPAVEITPEKMDLQKKPRKNEGQKPSVSEPPPEQTHPRSK
jgi:hypothetical protein